MIGIITHYFNSKNYGGMLQSYALCNVINNLGYDAEQISDDYFSENQVSPVKKKKILRYLGAIKNIYHVKYYTLKFLNIVNKNNFQIRNQMFTNFEHNIIPHSTYCLQSNLKTIVNKYDVIITGSDQVWNPAYLDTRRSYLLDFVPDDIRKISYAASISKNSLTTDEADIMIPLIKRMDSISVREKSSKNLLEKYITDKPISVELDPTLLLSESEWNKVCNEKDYGKEKYIFCYLLGDNISHREMAKNISKRTGLKVYMLSHIFGFYRKCDAFFGDKKLYDVGPSEFVGLIKNSEYVLTDSFHAVVFSSIYHKKFFVFKRDLDTDKNSMNSRITDILDDFSIPERLISDNGTISDELLFSNIDYSTRDQFINKRREESINYLRKALSGDNIEKKC